MRIGKMKFGSESLADIDADSLKIYSISRCAKLRQIEAEISLCAAQIQDPQRAANLVFESAINALNHLQSVIAGAAKTRR